MVAAEGAVTAVADSGASVEEVPVVEAQVETFEKIDSGFWLGERQQRLVRTCNRKVEGK